jgi:fibronectin type 3 domain-containing protein
MLKRPDTIAPSAPVIAQAFRSDSLKAIILEWRNSSSEDVVKYKLKRINVKDSVKADIAEWDTTDHRQRYMDTKVEPGNTYYYELIVADDSGNSAKELSGDIWFETGMRPSIDDWKGELDKEKKAIRLQWEYKLAGVKQYHIYRAKNDSPFLLYTTLNGSISKWEDEEVILGNIYKYKITAVLKGDVKSEMSKVVELRF